MSELKPNGDASTTVFDVLRSRQRRDVLRCLRAEGRMGLADLAAELARADGAPPGGGTEVEGGGSDGPPERGADEAARAEVSLHHAHLPKLADVGVVRYDPKRKTVQLSEDDDRLERYWAVLGIERARSDGR